ncbi:NO-inducible flavohemoprotein [Ktedonospora formicarum]|uniref:nitric oxide dioxygenase n=1 Tax=Ktedonospora formicarum TaxID=2778364 RepID=A0A8J3MU72_9CHLR|nr:NO-inducible flavohemoprotein [Ktedonospora formicarum]GHO46333.1 flavohemoprotein [Ktedonospora formicarum]
MIDTEIVTLSTEDIALAKSLVPVLKERGKEITSRFYATLFRDHPELLNIFNHSNQRDGLQQQALATSVYEAVANLDNLEAILPVVMHIAYKHRSLGVMPEHYPIVGDYLTKAIQEVLGNIVTPQIVSVWTRAYAIIAKTFIQIERDLYQEGEEQEAGWSGFRRFVVKHKVSEGEGLQALYLEPEDGGPLPYYKPGQYISVRVKIGKYDHLRQYSLIDMPGKSYYRIGVKLEGSEDGIIGTVSSYLHQKIKEGDILEASIPGGVFTLDQSSQRPVALLGAGIGITPLLSMLYTLRTEAPEREVIMAQAVRDGRYHSFAAEIKRLCGESGQVMSTIFYEKPNDEDRRVGGFDREGRIDEGWLREHIPANAEVYICGPRGFMQGIITALLSNGLKAEQLHYEVFGPALSFSVPLDQRASMPV